MVGREFLTRVEEVGNVERMKGVKVEVRRALGRAEGRGLLGCVERYRVERGCLELVLWLKVVWSVCLLCGPWWIFGKNGVRGEQVAS